MPLSLEKTRINDCELLKPESSAIFMMLASEPSSRVHAYSMRAPVDIVIEAALFLLVEELADIGTVGAYGGGYV